MKKLLLAIYRIYIYLVIIVTTVIILGLIFPLVLPFDRSGKISLKLGIIWLTIIRYASFMKVKVRYEYPVDFSESYVVVTNHRSHYDVVALSKLPFKAVKPVAKKELTKTPIFGWFLKKVSIVIDRNAPRGEAYSLIKSQMDRLKKDGFSVLIFPEGTRGRGKKLLPLKTGAFRLAVDHNLKLLPITIKGTEKILTKGSLAITPGSVELVVHKPIEIKGKDYKELAEEFKEIVEKELSK